VGDHACEYMTGGTVVILGRTGRNVGAGMTSGALYVYDDIEALPIRINGESVQLERMRSGDAEAGELRAIVERHLRLTHSPTAARLLDDWEEALTRFWKVVPKASLSLATPERTMEPAQAQGVAD